MSPRSDSGPDDGRVCVNVKIPASLNERLKKAASDRCLGPNLLVEAALVEFLERLPSLEESLG